MRVVVSSWGVGILPARKPYPLPRLVALRPGTTLFLPYFESSLATDFLPAASVVMPLCLTCGLPIQFCCAMKPGGKAAAALMELWEAAGITEGPPFRAVNRHGQVGTSMSGQAVREVVKETLVAKVTKGR